MGLGKTLQAISLLSYLKICQKSPGPFLVLCPLSVIDGWVSEVGKFAPQLRLLPYVGEKEHRRTLRGEMHEHVKELSLSSHVPTLPFDVLLTTYDIALIDQDFLSQFPWHYAIIDEAQRLKNPSSVLYNVLREQFVMPRKLLMTGTPIQNNITELWALMHFCMPLIFGTLEHFVSDFKEAGDPSCEDTEKVKEQFKVLKYVLGAFMLRRTKSKLVESGTLSLPPVTEITVCVDNSGNWGHGGLFDALARLSATIPNTYERASEFGDLHLGDLHLIAVTEDHGVSRTSNAPQWAGLAVVQSYNPRRKVPRSSISIADLEVCLAKASFSAAQYSGTVWSLFSIQNTFLLTSGNLTLDFICFCD
ncbi:UNVERIFIED_CONTAM: putative helicase CHR10 [Sesamum radiatum]|uniref:Helicase CHR10 n=1 Tax=Sesamum radiatum TaxID=300843 RepID=A0AAW2VBY7_SESRA